MEFENELAARAAYLTAVAALQPGELVELSKDQETLEMQFGGELPDSLP
jgi:hypothetical protein